MDKHTKALELDKILEMVAEECSSQDGAQLARELGHVRVRGLMAIPPVPAHPEDNRPYFLKMQQLFVDIRREMSDNQCDIDCLSMGMSGDFEDAIAEGATLVRVGTALFGPRPPMHTAR